MRVFRLIFLAIGAALGATPLAAQDRSAPLLEALAHVPAAGFDADSPWQVEFGDTRAAMPTAMLQMLRGSLLDPPQNAVFARVLPGDLRLMAMRGQGGHLQDAIGITAGDFETVLRVVNRPQHYDVMTLRAGTGAPLGAGLTAAGYMPDMRGGLPVWWRIDADYGMDVTLRDHANPFGGQLGRAARVAIDGDLVLHAPAWDLLEPMIGLPPENSLAADPILRVFAEALEHEGAGAGRPAFVFAHRTAAPGGVMVADMANGTQASGLLILGAEESAAAEALAARLARNWTEAISLRARRSYAELVPGTPVITVVPGSPAAVMLRVDVALDLDEPYLENRAAQRFLQILLADDLGPLLAP